MWRGRLALSSGQRFTSVVSPQDTNRLRKCVLTWLRADKYNVPHIMANVRLGSGESFESMLRRFGKQVETDRILAEVRRRRFYEKPSAIRKKKEAVKKRKSSR